MATRFTVVSTTRGSRFPIEMGYVHGMSTEIGRDSICYKTESINSDPKPSPIGAQSHSISSWSSLTRRKGKVIRGKNHMGLLYENRKEA